MSFPVEVAAPDDPQSAPCVHKNLQEECMADLLNIIVEGQVREALAQMQHTVRVFISVRKKIDYYNDTRQVTDEVCASTDQLVFDIHDMQADATLAFQHNVDKTPYLVIAAKDGEAITDFSIRMAGHPAGNGFSSLSRLSCLSPPATPA